MREAKRFLGVFPAAHQALGFSTNEVLRLFTRGLRRLGGNNERVMGLLARIAREISLEERAGPVLVQLETNMDRARAVLAKYMLKVVMEAVRSKSCLLQGQLLWCSWSVCGRSYG